MTAIENFLEYAEAALAEHSQKDAAGREVLFDAVRGREIDAVLDVGCGAGQELLPFLENTAAFCVGVDVSEGLGIAAKRIFTRTARAAAVRGMGERLPFADESFDVVLCRVALPYMDNSVAIAEASRVLRPGGVYLLKVHAPAFFFWMIRERASLLSLKALAYPMICIAAGCFQTLTGRQPKGGLWAGKETFQTMGFLRREFAKNGLSIVGRPADDNLLTPSFVAAKTTNAV